MNNKGTLITLVVIIGVIFLGVVLWWLQTNPPMTPGSESNATSSVSATPEDDTSASIQADIEHIDTGSTTQDMQQIDADINSL